MIDSRDRDMLRLLKSRSRPMTGNQIAKRIHLSPASVNTRLADLKRKGIVKKAEIKGTRVLDRKMHGKMVRVRAPRSVSWDLDLVKRKPTKTTLQNLARGRAIRKVNLARKKKK